MDLFTSILYADVEFLMGKLVSMKRTSRRRKEAEKRRQLAGEAEEAAFWDQWLAGQRAAQQAFGAGKNLRPQMIKAIMEARERERFAIINWLSSVDVCTACASIGASLG